MRATAIDCRRLLRVPFLWHGDDPEVGLDCWGAWKVVAAEAGLALPDDHALRFGTGDDVASGLDALAAHFVPIGVPPEGGWRVGDLIQQDGRGRGVADHVATIVDTAAPLALTTSERTGTLVLRLGRLQRIVGALRVREGL